MTLDSIEVPMPGTIKIMVGGVEHRVMRAEMTTDGLVIEAEPVDGVGVEDEELARDALDELSGGWPL